MTLNDRNALIYQSPRPPSRSSPNLLWWWQTSCNRKIKLLVSELGGGREVEKLSKFG